MITELYKCTNCGRFTEWDWSLGDEVLCKECWDYIAEYGHRKVYKEQNKDRIAEYQHQYYLRRKNANT